MNMKDWEEIYELACVTHNTDEPTDEQMQQEYESIMDEIELYHDDESGYDY